MLRSHELGLETTHFPCLVHDHRLRFGLVTFCKRQSFLSGSPRPHLEKCSRCLRVETLEGPSTSLDEDPCCVFPKEEGCLLVRRPSRRGHRRGGEEPNTSDQYVGRQDDVSQSHVSLRLFGESRTSNDCRFSAPNSLVSPRFLSSPLPLFWLPPMALDPLSSDSEFDNPGGTQEYHYESEGEERLANCARTLLREADGDYRREWISVQSLRSWPDNGPSCTNLYPGVHAVCLTQYLVFIRRRPDPFFFLQIRLDLRSPHAAAQRIKPFSRALNCRYTT